MIPRWNASYFALRATLGTSPSGLVYIGSRLSFCSSFHRKTQDITAAMICAGLKEDARKSCDLTLSEEGSIFVFMLQRWPFDSIFDSAGLPSGTLNFELQTSEPITKSDMKVRCLASRG